MLSLKLNKKLPHFTFHLEHDFVCEGITAILGVSGSGKSTLINLINGLIKPDSGSISLNGQTLVDSSHQFFVPPEKRHIGTVFQEALLFPHYSVLKNLTYGMASNGQKRFDEIIDVLNIRHLLNRYPAMLSGGEKQRISIGRAILSDPQLLLLDEPLSALDMPRKKELLIYIKQLVAELDVPMLYVTHNINETRQIAQHIAIFEQGQLIDYGETATILESPYLKEWL
ncbi:ATP-binding cassette domain-containing protein [Utexia brackfieldae]|uniref:molybdenum ABC transporter ATP-binding protein n=1 Tax=Utexia brackfieldae TaxID=3074108 RepID=UPI00370D50BF